MIRVLSARRPLGMCGDVRASTSQQVARHHRFGPSKFCTQNVACRRDRVRLSTVAHASPLSVLFPLFFLAPLAVFLGPIGCLPLLFAAPFLVAVWALSAALTLATVIVTSVVALAGAAAVGYFILPRVFGKSPSELQSEVEVTIKKRFGQGPVIDVQKNPSVDDGSDSGYSDLDQDLDDFDKTLRDRRRR